MNSWYTIRAQAQTQAQAMGAEVLIYDEIGAYGVSAKGFLAELGALPDTTPLALRINSPGGSVFDAVAIYNALKRHAGEITVWIDGIAASAASYIAMAGDEIVMPENAFMMIHDPSGLVMGTATEMRGMADTLDKIAGSMTRGYAGKSGKPETEIAALMAAETWFDAQDALDLGLATRMAEPVRIAASFDIGRFRNAPPVLVEAVEAAEIGVGETVDSHDGIQISDPLSRESGSTVTDPNKSVEAAEADLEAGPDAEPAPDPETLAADKTFDLGPEPAPPSEGRSTVGVANTAADASAIRAEAIAHARSVIDLCRLAGQPQMAGRFLEEDRGLDCIRAALLAAKADTDPDISSAHAQPGLASSTHPWGDVIARTFKLKG
ncbi:ATP-dependent Clp protease proteolytic subunit [Paracoccaceae bacterium Fryx2]|nr:ATP-dependent Clp protease proteolytic subunit [Paracoccaceae bacterium Fryx2]